MADESKFQAAHESYADFASLCSKGLYIGGQWVQPRLRGMLDVINPATEAVMCRCPAGTCLFVPVVLHGWPELTTPAAHATVVNGSFGGRRGCCCDSCDHRVGDVEAYQWRPARGILGSNCRACARVEAFSLSVGARRVCHPRAHLDLGVTWFVFVQHGMH